MSLTATTVSSWEFDGFDPGVEVRTDPNDDSARQKRTVSIWRRKRHAKGLTSFTSVEDTTASAASIGADYGGDTGITPSSGTWTCTQDALLPMAPGSGIYVQVQEWTLYGSWGAYS